jgi:quercetin dioxygenase-like cupin family protein
MDPINVETLDTFELTSRTSGDAKWVGQFFAYGGSGADQSTAIYFAMPPGKRLGRHTDTAEETQYVLSGTGELLLDEGSKPVRAGDVFVLGQGTAHDLRNTGSDDLRIIRVALDGASVVALSPRCWRRGRSEACPGRASLRRPRRRRRTG